MLFPQTKGQNWGSLVALALLMRLILIFLLFLVLLPLTLGSVYQTDEPGSCHAGD